MTTTVFTRLLVTAALLISPVAASAQSSSVKSTQIAENSVADMAGSSSAQPKAATVGPQEKKICKQLPSSYSRMTKRTCLTAEQWKQAEAEAQGN
jgi:hypothetical protein